MFGCFFAETSNSKSCDLSDLRRKKPGTLCSYTAVGFLIVGLPHCEMKNKESSDNTKAVVFHRDSIPHF